MGISELAARIKETEFSQSISSSFWIFPTIETVHVVALTLVFGSVALLDFRLLGLAHRNREVSELASETLPWTWGAFVLAVATGSLLFISDPPRYVANIAFQIKLVLLGCAGINMAIFHCTTYRSVAQWDRMRSPPIGAQVAASLSLLFWVGVIVAGRWVGFV